MSSRSCGPHPNSAADHQLPQNGFLTQTRSASAVESLSLFGAQQQASDKDQNANALQSLDATRKFEFKLMRD
ncbi:hypothetical protein [Leptospira sp. severe_002]|uniref:hypothetical protein n=1 Tax=Leptospira sp. severe_002 TaxID=2838237 RepID=UPI001E621BEB|nr:hypothetical protein [Leptospira sp. severe_002]